MSYKYSKLNEDVDVTLDLKVIFTNISYYDQLSEYELRERINHAKAEIKNIILSMIEDEYYQQKLASAVLFDYKIMNKEK